MNHFSRSNLIGLNAMCRELATILKDNGFTLVAVDGAASDTISGSSSIFYLTADVAADTQATEQPWGIILAASDVERTFNINVLPTLQVDETFQAAKRNALSEVGRLSEDGLLAKHFASMSDWGMHAEADLSVFPLAFDLVITDHGLAFEVRAEGFDNTGIAHSWFVAQRGLTAGEAEAGEKSPLFVIYSNAGGQKGDPDTLLQKSVQRFTAIERNINSATVPISAVVPTADGFPIINPLQQVMLAEDNTAIVLFPQIINTHRHVYFTTLDLLGYTSADVISAGSEVDLTPVATPTTYRGMNANGRDNRGLRLMFPVKTN